jgi:hypothetical protein
LFFKRLLKGSGLVRSGLAAAFAIAVAGCATSDPTVPPPATSTLRPVVQFVLPSTGTRPDRTLLRRLAGTLAIDPSTRCVYVVEAGGGEANVWWPVGMWATLDPFVVYDSRGAVVARAGEPVVFSGGVVSDEQAVAPPDCESRSRVWLVGALAGDPAG